MKTNQLLFLTLSFLSVVTSAQTKHDYYWTVGHGGTDITNPDFGGTDIDFNEDPPSLTRVLRDEEFGLLSSSICDEEGNLLFYTSGCKVMDSSHLVMENGDDLNKGTSFKNNCKPNRAYGSGYASIISLPDPFRDDLYYIIHQRREQGWPDEFSRVHYSKVDMTANNGKGKLIEANTLVMPDSVYLGEMAAVRHANGIDWWIVAPEDSTNVYNVLLLDSTGIIKHHDHTMGPKVGYYGAGSGQCKFSPDGKWFARWSNTEQVFLCKFDRTNGIISDFLQFHTREDPISGGIEFSPNSRFLYVSNKYFIEQYDLEDINFLQSRVTVAEWDGFTDFLPVTFRRMQLTPDCRIFVNGPGGHRFWHIIEHPNEKGTACLVRQHALALPTYTFNTMPYFPNFNLGPLGNEGYPCDSTRVSANSEVFPIRETEAWLYPNPATELVQIKTNLFENSVHVRVFDMQGKLKIEKIDFETNRSLDVSSLTPGLYVVMIYDRKGRTWTEKLIIK
ncbi:MAG: T9SS type A sorting domain-containing protein [Saprospiraceae bacterium]